MRMIKKTHCLWN